MILTGALVTVFILAIICIGAFLAIRNGGNGNGEEVAAVETSNALQMLTNEAVTITVAAIETEAARPTNTIVPTNTPRPTNTTAPTKTNTPVVSAAKETETPIANGTNVFAEGGGADSTPTAIAGLSGGGGGSESALPETGIDAWMAVLAGIVLIGILFGARRLRTG
ncbi:MAG: LPXTG cell wall anchor domain-containing protein [Anaerolineae bacterium]